MAVFNYVAMTGIAFLFARSMSVVEFGYYGIAIATVKILSDITPLGLEKLTLRAIPHYHITGEWSEARGLLRFSPFAVFCAALIICGSIVLYLVEGMHHGSSKALTIGTSVAFLPVVALFAYYLEKASAKEKYLSSTMLYRVLLPIIIFLAVFMVRRELGGHLSSLSAVLCYWAPWILLLPIMIFIARKALPDAEATGERQYIPRLWFRRSASFLVYNISLTLMANIGVIALGFLHVNKTSAGFFFAASQLSSILIAIATSTNRFYLPHLSMLIDRDESEGITSIFAKRRLVMVIIGLAFFTVFIFLGKSLLKMYGPDYADAWIPLLILTAGNVIAVRYSLSASYLQYQHHDKDVVIILIAAVATTLLLVPLLTFFYGIIGTAIACTVSKAVLFFLMQNRVNHVRRRILQDKHKNHLLLHW